MGRSVLGLRSVLSTIPSARSSVHILLSRRVHSYLIAMFFIITLWNNVSCVETAKDILYSSLLETIRYI